MQILGGDVLSIWGPIQSALKGGGGGSMIYRGQQKVGMRVVRAVVPRLGMSTVASASRDASEESRTDANVQENSTAIAKDENHTKNMLSSAVASCEAKMSIVGIHVHNAMIDQVGYNPISVHHHLRIRIYLQI